MCLRVSASVFSCLCEGVCLNLSLSWSPLKHSPMYILVFLSLNPFKFLFLPLNASVVLSHQISSAPFHPLFFPLNSPLCSSLSLYLLRFPPPPPSLSLCLSSLIKVTLFPLQYIILYLLSFCFYFSPLLFYLCLSLSSLPFSLSISKGICDAW